VEVVKHIEVRQCLVIDRFIRFGQVEFRPDLAQVAFCALCGGQEFTSQGLKVPVFFACLHIVLHLTPLGLTSIILLLGGPRRNRRGPAPCHPVAGRAGAAIALIMTNSVTANNYPRNSADFQVRRWKGVRDISVGGDAFGFCEDVNRAYVIR